MIFVDIWAWLALGNVRDSHHRVAFDEYRRQRSRGAVFVTTDYVLDDLISSLFARVGSQRAAEFIGPFLDILRQGGQYRLHRVSEVHFDQAWQLRLKYQDKPDISFTDLTSMAVTRDLGITDSLTGDRHFEHVGLGFRLLPQQT